ncbi:MULTISPECIES: hypothetical protein [Bacillaceae]|uniref:Uncharacterized protein n=1 Tax=Sutcliffiella horikoshii TaxID=79883 RepID=A0A5D4T9Z2_9BACI|nr:MULTISPECIES: hypothetical protein [Bacillaceae]TYS71711.1 hypothetical protein FZC75_11130 [Sutcliffiella horikoshii]
MKKYGLFFISFFAATYIVLVVLGVGDTFTKGIHVFILAIIVTIIHWMWDSFTKPTKQKRSE